MNFAREPAFPLFDKPLLGKVPFVHLPPRGKPCRLYLGAGLRHCRLCAGNDRGAAVGMVGALVLAVLFAFGRLASSKLIRVPVAIVLEFFRGMPVLLMMLFILLVASTGAFIAVVIALIVYNGAILGEALRAGILSLNKGQREAGLSIGLTPTRTRLLIELPQAFTQMLPIIMAQLVVLLKDTSLGYIVGYYELLRTVKNLATFFGNYYMFTFWLVGAVIYLAINLLVSWLGRRAARAVAAKRA